MVYHCELSVLVIKYFSTLSLYRLLIVAECLSAQLKHQGALQELGAVEMLILLTLPVNF